ncbi:glycosyl hydrolase family 18 protein [Treponema sp.]|uniref:glycosyl hydrolase family 18 protein n=1 Tax=Treponema sp. TaxID=166 RepID=UPI003F0C941B
MKRKIAILATLALSFFAFSKENLKFSETWSYVIAGRENEFSPDMPITDLCYFSAEINEYGEIPSIPDRSKIPAEYNGNVHLVAICESRSLTHFVLDPKYRVSKKIIRTLAEAAQDFDGLQIDFELVPARDAENFRNFLKALKKSIGNKTLSVCVPARTKKVSNDVYDYSLIEPYADRIFIMAYDQHWATSAPGPVSGMDWLKRITEHTLSELPAEKAIMGLPFYGRTWAEPNFSKAWYHSGITRILSENSNPEIQRTEEIPHFEFKTEVTVKGWFDDCQSLEARCRMLMEKSVPNAGFWRIGQEDREFWNLFSSQE